MKLKSKLKLASLGLIALTACTTTPKQSGSTSLADINTGVALPTELSSDNNIVGPSGCSLQIAPSGSSIKSFSIELKPGQEAHLVELPAGQYSYMEILCGAKHSELYHSKLPPFFVYPNKISLTQGFHVHVQESGHKLVYSLSSHEQMKTEALELLNRMNSEQKAKLVSSYTQQPLNGDAITKSGKWKKWEISHVSDGKPFKTSKTDWPSFKDCYEAERVANPLWLGELEFTATYQSHALSHYEITPTSWSTFTDEFKKCVVSGIESFQPPKSGELTYHIFL